LAHFLPPNDSRKHAHPSTLWSQGM
jgi:hypothetical protein